MEAKVSFIGWTWVERQERPTVLGRRILLTCVHRSRTSIAGPWNAIRDYRPERPSSGWTSLTLVLLENRKRSWRGKIGGILLLCHYRGGLARVRKLMTVNTNLYNWPGRVQRQGDVFIAGTANGRTFWHGGLHEWCSCKWQAPIADEV